MQFLSKDLDYGLDLLADVLKNPVFEEEVIKRQRHNLNVAREQRDDDIRASTLRRVMALLYQKHPNHLDLLGSKDTLAKIDRQDLIEYFHRFVVGPNIVVSVFGDMDSDDVQRKLESLLGNIGKGEVELPNIIEPPLKELREDLLNKDKQQAVVAMAFLAPSFLDQDRFPMELVNAVLGAGLSGRLFVKIRDQLGKAYTVGSSYTPGVDNGNIVLFCLTTNSKVDSVKAIMKQEIADLGEQVLTEVEFNDAKSYLKGTHQMGLNTVGAQAVHSAFNELYGLGYDHDDQYDAYVDKVTREQVKDVAKRYLDPKRAVVVTTMGNEN